MVSLSDGEWKIMNRLWERESTITELKNLLQEETGWDKHIIITMLSRMEKKGAVRHKDGGRAKVFYPLVSREEVSMQETRGVLQKVYRGSLGMMVNAMVEDQALAEEEIQELYGILEQAGKRTSMCGNPPDISEICTEETIRLTRVQDTYGPYLLERAHPVLKRYLLWQKEGFETIRDNLKASRQMTARGQKRIAELDEALSDIVFCLYNYF